jgi:hypothetical protein
VQGFAADVGDGVREGGEERGKGELGIRRRA